MANNKLKCVSEGVSCAKQINIYYSYSINNGLFIPLHFYSERIPSMTLSKILLRLIMS